MNGNGTELQQARFTHIEHRRCGAAVDREDLHQILILTLNIYFSLSRFHSSLRRRAAETSFRCNAGSTFPHFQDRRRTHGIMCEQKPQPVWLSAEKPFGLV